MTKPARHEESEGEEVVTDESRPHAGEEDHLGFERIVFFSDAVFAIVITLLVLPLTAEIELPRGGDVVHQLWEHWHRVITFVVSFLVIGRFWVAHHRMFGFLKAYDQPLVWCNLTSLLTVCFLPFPTAVLGASVLGADRAAVVFYAASMTVTSLALTGMWLYARSRSHLLRDDAQEARMRDFTTRSMATSLVFLLSIGAAFFGLVAALACWIVLLPLARHFVVRVHPQRSGEPKGDDERQYA